MPRASHILIAAAAGLSIGLLPLQFAPSPFGGGIAFAKNGDNGGGKGGGGGGGGGRGADKAGNNGKGGKGGGNGKSSAGTSAAKSGGSGGGLIKSLLRGNSGKSGGPKASTRTTNVRHGKPQKAAALPEVAEIPAAKPEKNLNARLGRLNSLNRNVNAYLNSKAAWFGPIQEYVLGSAEAELAADALVAAQEKFDDAVEDIIPYDGSEPLADTETLTLQTRLDALNKIALESPETVTSEQQEAFEAEIAALEAAIEAAGERDAAEAEATAAVAPTADDLEEALIAAGNPNFVPDDEIVEWATEVLDGKIAEVKEILAAEDAAEESAAPEPEPVEPVLVPVGSAL